MELIFVFPFFFTLASAAAYLAISGKYPRIVELARLTFLAAVLIFLFFVTEPLTAYFVK